MADNNQPSALLQGATNGLKALMKGDDSVQD